MSLEQQIFQHGPDGPPPDGGYTIKDDGGGNFLGKVGLLGLGGGIVSGVLFLTAEEGSPKKEQYGTIAVASTVVGVSCIFFERVF